MVEETRGPRENHRPIAPHCQIEYISSLAGFELTTLMVKTTDLSQVTDKLYHIMLYTLP